MYNPRFTAGVSAQHNARYDITAIQVWSRNTLGFPGLQGLCSCFLTRLPFLFLSSHSCKPRTLARAYTLPQSKTDQVNPCKHLGTHDTFG